MRKYAVMCTLLFLLGASGCSGIHMYNAENHEMAKMAKESFEKANIDEIVKQEYDLNKEMTKQRIEVTRKKIQAERNAILIELINSANWWKIFQDNLTTRLNKIYGETQNATARKETIKLIAGNNYTIKDTERTIAIYESNLKTTKYNLDEQNRYKEILNASIIKCKKHSSKRFNLMASVDVKSELGIAYNNIHKIKESQKKIKAEIKKRTAIYEEQIKKYQNATSDIGAIAEGFEAVELLKNTEVVISNYYILQKTSQETKEKDQEGFNNSITALEKLAKQAKTSDNKELGALLVKHCKQLAQGTGNTKDLDEVILSGYKTAAQKGNITAFAWISNYYLEQITTVSSGAEDIIGGLSAEGEIKKLQIQLNTLNKVLNELNSGKDINSKNLAPKTATHIKIALSIASLSKHYAKTKTIPTAGALKIEAERLRFYLASAQQRYDNSLELIKLYEQKFEALIKEAYCLINVDSHLNKIDMKNRSKMIFQIKDNADLAYALQNFIEAWTIWHAKYAETDNRIIALNDKSSLDSTVIALAQWNNLIAIPLARLEAYHASGLTTEQIAYFLQAAGIAAIAAVK